MTDEKKPDVTPQGNAPSWVDEVLGNAKATPTPPAPSTPLSGPADLKIPDSRPAAAPAPTSDDWVARATAGSARTPQMPSGPDVTPRPTQSTSEVLSDFMRPIVNDLSGKAAPPAQTATPAQTQARSVDAWGDPAQQPVPAPASQPYSNQTYSSGDVSQKKLIAGLLAIFLGSFGVHKFYLGMNNPGIIMLGLNVGSWIVAFILGMLMLIVGLAITLPLAGLISTGLGILGLVEGILYLTKSDADFQREYLIGKKPWL